MYERLCNNRKLRSAVPRTAHQTHRRVIGGQQAVDGVGRPEGALVAGIHNMGVWEAVQREGEEQAVCVWLSSLSGGGRGGRLRQHLHRRVGAGQPALLLLHARHPIDAGLVDGRGGHGQRGKKGKGRGRGVGVCKHACV